MNQYTFTRLIDGELYSGRVPAESWESAQSCAVVSREWVQGVYDYG